MKTLYAHLHTHMNMCSYRNSRFFPPFFRSENIIDWWSSAVGGTKDQLKFHGNALQALSYPQTRAITLWYSLTEWRHWTLLGFRHLWGFRDHSRRGWSGPSPRFGHHQRGASTQGCGGIQQGLRGVGAQICPRQWEEAQGGICEYHQDF